MSFAIVLKLTFKSRVCFRVFCHGIAKRADCKVEFNQSCWLYSVPNLLVIQHVENLYLRGNNVRVMYERM